MEELWVRIDDGEIEILNTMDATVDTVELEGEYGDFQAVSTVDPYTGPTEITPTQYTQVLPFAGKTADTDITINPIPSNYGLITWNGAVLTVS